MFGLLSSLYIVALLGAIVLLVGGYLVDPFYLLGSLLTAGIALWYLRRPLKQVFSAGASLGVRWVKLIGSSEFRLQAAGTIAAPGRVNAEPQTHPSRPTQLFQTDSKFRRLLPSFLTWRRLVAAMLVVLIVGTLLMPWSASVGNYGTLSIIPGQEPIIRAPESGTLAELRVGLGDVLTSGAVVGRMSSVELEDQTAEARSELARAKADNRKLHGE